jgi:SDR family mycofactocin-dependent oxidoreductase
MGRLDGKVAFITGAARGQGRSHALRMAQEGADVIAIDVCEPIKDMTGPGATEADLAETVRGVEALNRRIIARKIDVRDFEGLTTTLTDGVEELGRLDVVSVNAAITGKPKLLHEMSAATWQEMIDIDLTGAWNTARAAVPHLIASGGGSIIFTSSVAGVKGSANMGHYVAAKHGVMGLMKAMAKELAGHSIRVNSVLPTQVRTPMLMNDDIYRLFSPELENPTVEDFTSVSQGLNVLPIPWVEVEDISNALLFLASEEARYITGVGLPVDAGALIK